jgi:hypothetical protein
MAGLLSISLVVAAVFLGGGGHGTPIPLIAIFPIAPLAALAGRSLGNACDICGLVAALVQLPLYALAVRSGAHAGRLRVAAMLVAGTHLVLIAIAVQKYL